MARKQARKSSRKQKSGKLFPRGTVAIVDDLLLRPHPIALNGETQRVRTIEAIVLQLLEKAINGNARAWQTLVRYQEFADRRMRKGLAVQFVDSEYTRGFSKPETESGDG